MSGYGKWNNVSDLLSVRFVYEENVKFLKNFKLVRLEHHIKSKTNQLIIINVYNFLSIET